MTELPNPLVRDPAVLDLLIRVRVIELKRDARAGALPLFPKPGLTKTRLQRPRYEHFRF